MAIRLHQIPHSPYCLPVVRVLESLRVPFSIVNVSNGDRSPLIRLTQGAYYQVPILEVESTSSGPPARLVFEGSDSSADGLDVARFLDRTWAHGRLFPHAVEGLQAILIPHIESELEGLTFKLADVQSIPSIADLVERTLIVRHKERRFGKGCVEHWRAQAPELTRQLQQLLRPYEQMLSVHPFLLGPAPVYADFALYGVLANLTYQNWNPFPAGLPQLAAWYERIRRFEFPQVAP